MDNLSSHKRASVRAIIEARGARLAFLPPYSPDFNPIEMAFAKLKALLRKAAERTVDGLWNAIGRLVDVFTPQECANYFAAAGWLRCRLIGKRSSVHLLLASAAGRAYMRPISGGSSERLPPPELANGPLARFCFWSPA